MKALYEEELRKLRQQLEMALGERSGQEMLANKHIALASELEGKLQMEFNERKKTEVALGESHRLLTEKDGLLQELRINISEQQNAHQETSTERDQLQANLGKMQDMFEDEATQKK